MAAILFLIYRLVKLSSPRLNYIIILGSVLLYLSVFFYSYTADMQEIQTTFCNVRFGSLKRVVNVNLYRFDCGCFPWDIIFVSV